MFGDPMVPWHFCLVLTFKGLHEEICLYTASLEYIRLDQHLIID
jgi:hypothetical protein